MTLPPFPALLILVFAVTPALAQQSTKTHTVRHRTQTTHRNPSTVAPQWNTVYQDSTVTVSLDPRHTKKLSDGTYTAHLRWEYAADQTIGRGKSYRMMRETRLLDCDSLRTKPLSAYTFDAKGKSVSSFDTPLKGAKDIPWGKRKPGTTSAGALAGVCQAMSRKATP